ncbi:MAG TPA: hypothetical protein VD861_10270, partial [Pyrinomonadaceae bacterium]|nr:hypothetical protein [Pyrinomonadaceae bacterium]
MRRTLMVVSLLIASSLSFACGERGTTTTDANAQANTPATQGSGANASSGPKTQGIGGAPNGNA